MPAFRTLKNRHALWVFLLSTVCVSLVSAFVLWLPFNPYPDLPNAQKITQVRLCQGLIADCEGSANPYQAARLPILMPPHNDRFVQAMTIEFEFDRADIEADNIAIFLPRYSDGLNVMVNGARISPDDTQMQRHADKPFLRLGHFPFYTNLPENSLMETGNTVQIELQAYSFSWVKLMPVYIGDSFRLRIANNFRFIARTGYVRLAFSLHIGVGFILILFWLSRHQDKEYGWAVASNVAAAIICWHYIYPNVSFSAHTWTLIWNIAIQLYIYTLYRYGRAVLERPPSRALLWLSLYCLISSTALCLTPVSYLAEGLKFYHLGNGIVALFIPYLFLRYQSISPKINTAHFLVFCLVIGFATRDYLYTFVSPKVVMFQTGQFIPFIIFSAITGLLMTRLALALNKSERLQHTMQATIIEKSAEIVTHEKQQAIDKERHRIMLDLHDGVGGQLVNTLAYMTNASKSDPVVRASMEAALRDMALIIDSLEGYEDLETLLGSLRARIEPLLDQADMQLLWEIDGAPHMETQHVSQNLNIIRIVQEAVTNAVKHSRSKTITIRSDKHAISVLDDGCGFDLDAVRAKKGTHSGIGVNGMKYRAEEAGVTCYIKTSAQGTEVNLKWPHPQSQSQ